MDSKKNKIKHTDLVLGIDEAGRGPVIGPMIIVGFGIRYNKYNLLEEIKPKDSKQLSRRTREIMFDRLIDLADKLEIKIIKPIEIDNALKTINLNYLELLNFSHIINKIKPNIVYIDAVGNIESSLDFIKANLDVSFKDKIEIVMSEKADSRYLVVSAASIIAKVIRDREVDKIKEWLINYRKRNKDKLIDIDVLNIGSGYSSDPKTIKFIKELVNSKNRSLINNEIDFIRREWETFKRIRSESKNNSLLKFNDIKK